MIIFLFSLVNGLTSPTCSSYSYWNGQQCVKCQQYCSCSTYLGCTTLTCPSGYVEYSNSCLSCPLGCLTCETQYGNWDFTCLTCQSGYQLLTGMCIKLASIPIYTSNSNENYEIYSNPYNQPTNSTFNQNCAKYSESSSLCISCPDTSFLNEFNSCESCVSGCQQCNSRGTCLSCQSGYYWANSQNQQSAVTLAKQYSSNNAISGYYTYGAGACTRCSDSNALTCNSTQSLTCNSGYYLQNNQCASCSTGCTTCTSSSACSQCITGYLLQNSLCYPCNGNSQTIICNSCSNLTQCQTCLNGYQLVNGDCILCSSQIIGCLTCVGGSNDSVNCQTCKDGYYMTTTQGVSQCSQCPSNVLLCSSNTNYIQCVDGYLLIATGQTQTCIKNINGCFTGSNITLQQCESCYTGQYLVNGFCQTCSIAGCTTCTLSGNSPNQSLQCTKCASNLSSGLNYYPNSSTCTPCTAGCLTCTSNQCSGCQSGYVYSNNTCSSCLVSNCSQCSCLSINLATQLCSETKCTSCLSGYYLQSQTCLLCPVGCNTCTNTGSGIYCNSCLSGYYLKNGGCSIGVAYCASINSDGLCDQCQYGLRLVYEICLPCIYFYGGVLLNYNLVYLLFLVSSLHHNIVMLIFILKKLQIDYRERKKKKKIRQTEYRSRDLCSVNAARQPSTPFAQIQYIQSINKFIIHPNTFNNLIFIIVLP
ncbi:hypothetical protein pb186bvf_014970 [Paramecium bursaria]